jgi:formate dehydrogenase
VVKGGWHIAEYLTRSYDVEGMHAGTVAAGRIGLAVLRRLKPFDMHLHPRQRPHSPLRARQDHDHGRLDDDARPYDDELGLLTMAH